MNLKAFIINKTMFLGLLLVLSSMGPTRYDVRCRLRLRATPMLRRAQSVDLRLWLSQNVFLK